MTDPVQASDGTETEGQDGGGRSWRPSRSPEHQRGASELRGLGASAPRIVERHRRNPVRLLAELFRRPVVKLIVAVALLITGVIIFDATVNKGSWTERAQKPKGYNG